MTRDQVLMVLIAAGWSVGVGVVGAVLWSVLRRSSIRWGMGLVCLAAVGGVVAGVVGTSRAMFLSQHDLQVVVTVCAVSGVVSLVFTSWLARSIVTSVRQLTARAGAVGRSTPSAGEVSGPRELREVAAALAEGSRRLQAARAREQELEQSRRELVAWVSHDLRTPLSGIRAMTEALNDGMAEDPQRYHAQVLAEVDRLTRMVDDLFELSRIHAGALNLTLEQLGLRDVVSQTLAAAGPVARARGVRIDGDVEPDLEVRADPDAMARVIANLVTNAIRHTPADGAVTVTAHSTGAMVELSVTDSCGGIPVTELPRVFDVAWRGNHARTPEPDSGAGLGLAIVKGLIEAHDGTVSVDNHASGCRFVVRLPA